MPSLQDRRSCARQLTIAVPPPLVLARKGDVAMTGLRPAAPFPMTVPTAPRSTCAAWKPGSLRFWRCVPIPGVSRLLLFPIARFSPNPWTINAPPKTFRRTHLPNKPHSEPPQANPRHRPTASLAKSRCARLRQQSCSFSDTARKAQPLHLLSRNKSTNLFQLRRAPVSIAVRVGEPGLGGSSDAMQCLTMATPARGKDSHPAQALRLLTAASWGTPRFGPFSPARHQGTEGSGFKEPRSAAGKGGSAGASEKICKASPEVKPLFMSITEDETRFD